MSYNVIITLYNTFMLDFGRFPAEHSRPSRTGVRGSGPSGGWQGMGREVSVCLHEFSPYLREEILPLQGFCAGGAFQVLPHRS